MLNTPEFRSAWPLLSLLPADTQQFLSALYDLAEDPDPVATLLGFVTRQSVLRAWAEFQEEHPLILAPIAPTSPSGPTTRTWNTATWPRLGLNLSADARGCDL